MKLHNEFTVDAPLEDVWRGLLDMERVASCMPGASLEPDAGGEVHRGTMRVKLGPMNLVYEGAARLTDVDEDSHTASIEVTAKESGGQGTASATVTNRVEPRDGSGTLVVAETDLRVTGRQAQFGRGMMQDVASGMLDEFARRFEQSLREPARIPGPVESPAPSPRPPEAPPVTETEVLDLGAALAGRARRVALAAGAAVVVALVAGGLLRRRRRSSITLRLDHNW